MALNFDLNDLIAFRAVAELGSFRKAAESVHLSQPAFSRRVEKLEQALGVRLLERTTRRVTLTTVGREFERKVRDLLDELDTTLLVLRGDAATRMGEVKLACVPSAMNHYLPDLLRRYRSLCPRVRVKVIDVGANEVLAAVSGGDADFGLGFIGAEEGDIDFRPLVEEAFVLACRRDHPLARRRNVAWEQLAGHDTIAVAQSSGNRLLLDQALAGLVNRARSSCETQHVASALSLVEAGLGVAPVPAMAMPAGHPTLTSVPLTQPVVTRRVGLLRRRRHALSPAAQQLFDLFTESRPHAAAAGTLVHESLS